MVAVLSNDGKLSQQVRYSAYGVPYGLPAGDTDANGSIVSTPDITQMNGWISGPYDVRGDLDLDGDVDNDDMNVLVGNFGLGLGWNKLAVAVDSSLSGVLGGHRKGYCGYEHDWVNHSIAHVRNRAYFAELGRWTRRDPLGYVDGGNLYGYVGGKAFSEIDSHGLQSSVPSTWPWPTEHTLPAQPRKGEEKWDILDGNPRGTSLRLRRWLSACRILCESARDNYYACCGQQLLLDLSHCSTVHDQEIQATCFLTATTRYRGCMNEAVVMVNECYERCSVNLQNQ